MNTEAISASALLAEASYADFEEVNFSIRDEVETALHRIGTDEGDRDDPDKGFSFTQARQFTEQWEVVHHQPDTDSGFSATLFRSTDSSANQPYVLAIRGTEQFLEDLVITDGSDIVVDGLALDQIVDLWNYWKQLITSKGENFIGSQLVTLAAETAALTAAKLGQVMPGFNMTADAYLELLYGFDGEDYLAGGDGKDYLNGGGVDTLFGGEGDDILMAGEVKRNMLLGGVCRDVMNNKACAALVWGD